MKFYVNKKGLDKSYGIIIIVNFIWKSLVLIILILLEFLLQFLGSFKILRLGEIIIINMILTYFCDILLGIVIFNYFFNQKIEESIIIISIIVLVEMIIDNSILYPLMIFISVSL